MARNWHGHPLCRHEAYGPCDRWWCTYRLLIGVCALFLAPVGVYAVIPPGWAGVTTIGSFVLVVVLAVAVTRWVAAEPPRQSG